MDVASTSPAIPTAPAVPPVSGAVPEAGKTSKLFTSIKDTFKSAVDPKISPQQMKNLMKYGGILGIVSNLFTHEGFGKVFNFDNVLNVMGIIGATVPGAQFLMLPVAAYYLYKTAGNVVNAVGSLMSGNFLDAGMSLLAAGVTAISALPVGRIAGLGAIWKGTSSTKAFGLKAVRHLYGDDVARSVCNVTKTFSAGPSGIKEKLYESTVNATANTIAATGTFRKQVAEKVAELT